MCVSYISNCARVNTQCSTVYVLLKPGFYMSERSKTIEDFTFVFMNVPDFADISGNRQKSDRFSRDTILYV